MFAFSADGVDGVPPPLPGAGVLVILSLEQAESIATMRKIILACLVIVLISYCLMV
jgi:hypothetical protein